MNSSAGLEKFPQGRTALALAVRQCNVPEKRKHLTRGFHVSALVVGRGDDTARKRSAMRRAAGRWLDRWGTRYAPWQIIVPGDDLYTLQPFCQRLLDIGFGFILTCKSTSDHAHYEWVDELVRVGLHIGGRQGSVQE